MPACKYKRARRICKIRKQNFWEFWKYRFETTFQLCRNKKVFGETIQFFFDHKHIYGTMFGTTVCCWGFNCVLKKCRFLSLWFLHPLHPLIYILRLYEHDICIHTVNRKRKRERVKVIKHRFLWAEFSYKRLFIWQTRRKRAKYWPWAFFSQLYLLGW